jgi:hypothetical protein
LSWEKNEANSRSLFCTIFNGKIEAKIRGKTLNRVKSFEINGAGGGNRTHGLGIMRPSLYH